MKRKKSGFTLVELMTVLAVITILVALLIPALSMVRRMAKETQQKAQLTAIDLALLAFKSDYGDYPPSSAAVDDYCGAQKLAEALLGQDLLGFHPDSLFRRDGTDKDGQDLYPPNLNPSNPSDEANLKERVGPYLERASANAFRLGRTAEHDGLFQNTGQLYPDLFVICDVFGIKKITLRGSETVKAGTPILYYKANTSSKVFHTGRFDERIYDYRDNIDLIRLGLLSPDAEPADTHKLLGPGGNGTYFYEEDYKIVDQNASSTMAPGVTWPHRPDSYILITAGADGEYGTKDDICNF